MKTLRMNLAVRSTRGSILVAMGNYEQGQALLDDERFVLVTIVALTTCVPVVSIAGDGGALFSITELATAVHHNIPVNIVVMNDNAFGNVKGIQGDEFEGRYIASDLTSPDFVALARCFGVTAARANTPNELEHELTKAIANDGPGPVPVIG